MRYYLDTEFIDTGNTIDLISIGLVCEDGRELSMQSCEFDESKATPWIQVNVFPHLDISCSRFTIDSRFAVRDMRNNHARQNGQCLFAYPDKGIIGAYAECSWRTREQMANEIKEFCKDDFPELWGWCCSYDYVILCQVFGGMLFLPSRFPHYIYDIQQILDKHGIPDEDLPKQEGIAHNALSDAKYVKTLYEWLAQFRKEV